MKLTTAALAALTLIVASATARADGTTYTFSPTGTSLFKAGNWYLNGVNVQTVPTAAGTIGSINEAGGTTTSNGPIGWNVNTNVGGTFGTIDVVSGATNQVFGIYTTKSSSAATSSTITLEGATLNSISNTVIANSSGSTVVFENDIVPSGDIQNVTGLTTYSMGNTTNAIQATSNSNIIIDNVITGSGAALTFLGSGNASTTGATLELGAGSANDVTGGVAANAPVSANGGTFTGTPSVQSSDTNSFTGGLTIGDVGGTANAGVVKIDGAHALPTTGTVTVNTSSQLLLNGSATYGGSAQSLALNGTGTTTTAGALTTASGNTSTWAGTMNIASTSSINVQGSGGSLAVTGSIGGVGQLQSVGAGTLKLNNSNNFSGGLAVNAGSVVSGNANSLGSSNVSVAGGALSSSISATTNIGGTLSLSSGSIALTSSATPTLTLASGQNFNMTGGTLSLSLSGGNAGSIASADGTGTFDITGGTLNLNNSFSGAAYSQTYDVLSGFGSGDTVSNLSITNYDSTDYTANLSTSGVLSFSAVATPEPNSWILGAIAIGVFVGLRRRVAGRVL